MAWFVIFLLQILLDLAWICRGALTALRGLVAEEPTGGPGSRLSDSAWGYGELWGASWSYYFLGGCQPHVTHDRAMISNHCLLW